MLILGLNVFHADASAVLVQDGRLICAVAEERLTRIKHFAGFPIQAIRECLRIAGAEPSDIDRVVVARNSRANLLAKLGYVLKNLSRIPRLARQRLENRARVKSVPEILDKGLGLPPSELKTEYHYVEHHLAHLASAFLVSPFERAALLSLDGFGDFASAMWGRGEGPRIWIDDRVLFPHSLGILYTTLCQFIGFGRYGDEGKVMALAASGKDAYADFFNEALRLRTDGGFELDLSYFVHHSEGVDYSFDAEGKPSVAPLYSAALVKRLGPPRRRQEEFAQREKDLAHSLQACLERAYCHILTKLHEETGLTDLALAGGVALNSVANGKILQCTPFERVFIQPAASDDGTALGGAFYIWNGVLGHERDFVMEHALWGGAFEDEGARRALEDAKLPFITLNEEELREKVVSDLTEGKIVGWFQERMEWGPRALGARSILAHPGLADIKDRLNARIKHREWFRPFAASVLEERVEEVFEAPHSDPFMLMVFKVRRLWRSRVRGVVHVDDTCRIQTVSERIQPQYYRLIREFESRTGLPIVLNTSFNENEPIVCRPKEAVDCFLRTYMDALAIGRFYTSRAMRGE